MSRLSDILIAITLLVNAIAMISSKFSPVRGDLRAAMSAIPAGAELEKAAEEAEPVGFGVIVSRLVLLVRSVRQVSCFIAIWNMVFFVLVLLVFS